MSKRQPTQHAQVAKLIKAELRQHGIKCTVKSSSFSMGNSVDINVENQPPWVMEAIKKQTDKYEYGSYCHYQDIQTTKNRDFDGPQTKYLTINNYYTEELKQAAWVELCDRMQELQGLEDKEPHTVRMEQANCYGSDFLYRYLNGSQSDFCYFKKPVKQLEVLKPVILSTESSYTIEEHTHTKKEMQIFICINPERVSKEEFDSERKRARALFGWYSRKWGSTPCGFAFASIKAAKTFAGIPTTPEDEPTKLENITVEFVTNVIDIKQPADTKRADKFETLADNMQSKIDDFFRDRPTHTPRMMKQFQSAQLDGQKLERGQKLLRALSVVLRDGTITDELRVIGGKAQAIGIVSTKKELVTNGYHDYFRCTGEPLYDDSLTLQAFGLISGTSEEEETKKGERDLQHKIASVKNSKITGYFPTTGQALEQLMTLADINAGHRCLEPSAGRGDIADEIQLYGAFVDCIESNYALVEILELKGHNTCQDDFLSCKPDFTRYDRIVMNPPFEHDDAAAHIEHALKFLETDGLLTAIIPNGMMNKTTPKIRSLQNLLDGGYEIIEMDAKSFSSEGTNVNTQIIQIWG